MNRAYNQNRKGRSAFNILTVKPTGKKHIGDLRRRQEDNVRMDLKEIGVNWRNLID